MLLKGIWGIALQRDRYRVMILKGVKGMIFSGIQGNAIKVDISFKINKLCSKGILVYGNAV